MILFIVCAGLSPTFILFIIRSTLEMRIRTRSIVIVYIKKAFWSLKSAKKARGLIVLADASVLMMNGKHYPFQLSHLMITQMNRTELVQLFYDLAFIVAVSVQNAFLLFL